MAKLEKDIYILGINESHTATAALLKNGSIICCASEERFTRKKGQWGYPKFAVHYCLQEANITIDAISAVYFGFKNPVTYVPGEKNQPNPYGGIIQAVSPHIKRILLFLVGLSPVFFTLYSFLLKTLYPAIAVATFERSYRKYITRTIGLPLTKIKRMDHHLAHAMSAYYANPAAHKLKNKPVLVITNDGYGDDVCSRIYTVKNNSWIEIASTPNHHSIGLLYQYVTEYLGMKPNEHEYKVMGLAPYASSESATEVKKLFRKLFWVDGLSVKSAIPTLGYYSFLEKNLSKVRFDAIAGGIQACTEELLVELVRNSIERTNIHSIVLGGGVFMNVKANKVINELPGVDSVFVMPSCGDESTAIGAAYYGYKKYCEGHRLKFELKPLSHLYLGPAFDDTSIKKSIVSYVRNKPMSFYKMKYPAKEVAQLLSKGHVVARLAGRMEFGARALGNLSILANPSNPSVIRTINKQIKIRDFWMPFAPVILKKLVNDYLIFPRQNGESPFMMFAFNTTNRAQKDMPAAIHPFDDTARPQILSRQQNPDYYDIVAEFERITGIGALLNTSFNLHGEPIVLSPLDALQTFHKSGLQYLQLGQYIVMKNKSYEK